MQIVPNQTFKHQGKTYEEGQSYDVTEGEAYYFGMVGWTGEKAASPSEPVTLDIQDVRVKTGAEVS